MIQAQSGECQSIHFIPIGPSQATRAGALKDMTHLQRGSLARRSSPGANINNFYTTLTSAGSRANPANATLRA